MNGPVFPPFTRGQLVRVGAVYAEFLSCYGEASLIRVDGERDELVMTGDIVALAPNLKKIKQAERILFFALLGPFAVVVVAAVLLVGV